MYRTSYLSILFLLFISNKTLAQIEISILKAPHDLTVKDYKNKEYLIEIANIDTVGYLLYNFSMPSLFIDEENDSLVRSSAFSWISIRDSYHRNVEDHNARREVSFFPLQTHTLDSLDINLLRDFYGNCIEDRLILKPKERKIVGIKFNISNYNLKRGVYFIKYSYINGLNFKKIVDNNAIMKDEKKFNAKVYYGHIQSHWFRIKIH